MVHQGVPAWGRRAHYLLLLKCSISFNEEVRRPAPVVLAAVPNSDRVCIFIALQLLQMFQCIAFLKEDN